MLATIVRVSDQRVVVYVVLEIVFLDLLPQLQDFFRGGAAGFSRYGIGWSCGHGAAGIFNSQKT